MMQSLETPFLEGAIGQRVRAAWEGNLSQLDWEKDFLAPFREKTSEAGYVGLGKTLSGLIHAARLHGSEADALRRKIVSELLSTQEADGYLGIYEPASRTYKVWDVHEQAYLLQALVENAQWFGDSASLRAAERLARWMIGRLSGERWRDVGKNYIWNPLAIIGLDRAMEALSRATGDPVFGAFNREELELGDWFDPIVENRQGEVCGHAYAYLARSLAQLEETADAELPEATQAVISYLRAGGGLVVSGTCGHTECWHSDQRMDGKLGETCTTAYLIRWAAHLLRRTHKAWFGDLMERAIYNALFAASDASGRRIRYYAAGEGKRTWYESDTYCCPGNYRRIIGELPDFIIRPHQEGLAIDLYESGRFTVPCGDQAVGLEIETDYPFENSVSIIMTPERAATFQLSMRVPGWAREVSVSLNGERIAAAPQKGWLTMERQWQYGDRVDLVFDMPWRLVRGMRLQKNKVAILRGPVVWGADPADNKTLGERLGEVVPEQSSCLLRGDRRTATVRGELDGQLVEVALVPYYSLDTAVTYFTGRPGMGDECDHLLWLATDPIGVGVAPGE
jgi:DUF1680 family protein